MGCPVRWEWGVGDRSGKRCVKWGPVFSDGLSGQARVGGWG